MQRKYIDRSLAASLVVTIPSLLFASADRPETDLSWIPSWFFWSFPAYSDAFLNVISGYVMSVIFYFLLVWMPDHYRRTRVTIAALNIYDDFKRQVIGLIFSASGKGYGLNEIDDLCNPEKFRKYFNEDETGSGARWYEFVNGLDAYHAEKISTEIAILRDEIQFVVHSAEIEDFNTYIYLKGISAALYSITKTDVSYDGQKIWARFLWSVFTLWDTGKGYLEEDPIRRALAKI